MLNSEKNWEKLLEVPGFFLFFAATFAQEERESVEINT
jgi:hypothetical protein